MDLVKSNKAMKFALMKVQTVRSDSIGHIKDNTVHLSSIVTRTWTTNENKDIEI